MSSHTHPGLSAKACESERRVTDSNSITAGALLYSRYAAAGGFCCSFTHAVLTPIDVYVLLVETLTWPTAFVLSR